MCSAPTDAASPPARHAPPGWLGRLAAACSTFRCRLALAVGGLTLVALLSIGLYAGDAAMDARRAQSGEQLSALTRNAAELMAAMLQEREKEVVILGQTDLLRTGDLASPEVTRALGLRKAATEEYAWMGIASPDGTVLNATAGLLVGGRVAVREWFRQGLRQTFTGDVHDAVLLAKLLARAPSAEPLRFIDIATPILDATGNVRGVLGTHIHWNWVTATIHSAVDRERAGEGVEVFLVSREGKVLYPAARVGEALPEGLPAAGYATRRWADGEDYLVSQWTVPRTKLSDLGWRIVVRQPVEVALASVKTLRRQLVGAGIAASLALAALAYLLAVRVSRPIERLAGVARRVRDGERVDTVDYPRRSGSAEMEHLSLAVQDMTEALLAREAELHALNTSLEQTVAERTAALTRANLQLSRLAAEDGLTGVANRRSFDQRLGEEVARMRRRGQGFALMLVDVDRFKSINDGFGHPAGDRVLVELAQLLREGTRGTDLVARYGGEEFAVVLPEIRAQADTELVAEKLRRAVETHAFPAVGRVTISIGLAWLEPGEGSETAALQRADAALYRAKSTGRNRCVASWAADPVATTDA